MRKILLLLIIVASYSANAQLKVIVPNGTVDLSGTIIQTVPNQVDEKRFLWMVNETDETLSLHCRRTELNVVPGTTNNICWVICPAIPQNAGEVPVWIAGLNGNPLTETVAPGDTVFSFDFIYNTEGNPGCSEFLVEIIDAVDGTVYTDFNIYSSACVLNTTEAEQVELSISPNPVQDMLNIGLDSWTKETEVYLLDVLGSVQGAYRFEDLLSGSRATLNLAGLPNGLYFLNIVEAGVTRGSERLIIHH